MSCIQKFSNVFLLYTTKALSPILNVVVLESCKNVALLNWNGIPINYFFFAHSALPRLVLV